jgi:hypothetical protein
MMVGGGLSVIIVVLFVVVGSICVDGIETESFLV